MRIVDIRQARKRLSRLVAQAAGGQSFIIARDGRPMVRVEPITAAPRAARQRLGFLSGQFTVPEDFDTMGREETEALFDGD